MWEQISVKYCDGTSQSASRLSIHVFKGILKILQKKT